jgi:GrpB-like predicted nucleotidyltransferase (UPF0157 family)
VNPPGASRIVQVVEYDPRWPEQFCLIRDRIWPCVGDIAIAIEHVGSTSVPGLAAKPVIDMDIVIPSRNEFPVIAMRLATLGYQHRGNLGIEDREAFWAPERRSDHHLYVCPRDSVALRNHIALRDHLRAHPLDAAAYSNLKRQLAERFSLDVDRYVEGKTDFILSILTRQGFSTEQLDLIGTPTELARRPGCAEALSYTVPLLRAHPPEKLLRRDVRHRHRMPLLLFQLTQHLIADSDHSIEQQHR